ncbi:MAG: AzlC family ABC transporter permease [Clostridia bacterium]|nr:AzlC family ABC transporter permease [Clostridia bacterium]
MKNSLYLKGLKDGFPIFLGYFAVSFTFGISAISSGLLPFQAVLISATNFTSAGQFAALSIISGSLSYFEMALTQFIINLRYCLMSSSLTQKFKKNMPVIHRFLIAFGNTDEVFAVCSLYPDKLSPSYCYGVISAALPGWVGGTLLGSLSGSLLPKSVLSAFGIALYGMFIAIILPPARKNKFIAVLILISMILSMLISYLPYLKNISSGFRIIILTVLLAGIAAFIKPIEESEETK